MASKTVLIVDDEREIRFLLAETLRRAEFNPIQAADIESALAVMRSVAVDVFLLDIDLDGSSGLQLCRMIRERDKVTPIIFVTGSDTTTREAFAAGCDDIVAKPVEPMVLLARMKGHLQRTQYARQLARSHEMLEHYVSRRTREVVERSAAGETVPPIEHREVTVMFTDVRGFTALSEILDPEVLFALLSAQLAIQVNLVHEFGGYVDKFGGDGLMAVFDSEDMAVRACVCALRIIEQARSGTISEPGLRQLGIGINKGTAIIGNIGSQEHLDYSVIGTTVNFAARLCGYALPMSIVVSNSVRDAVTSHPELRFEHERQVEIRGIQGTVPVYNLEFGERKEFARPSGM